MEQTPRHQPVRILGIAGSLRRDSYNRATLRAAVELVPEGASIETFELDDIPAFNQDEEQNAPAKVVELKRRVREADAILFVTPEYNYSVPGVTGRRGRTVTVRGMASLRQSWAPRSERLGPRALNITCGR